VLRGRSRGIDRSTVGAIALAALLILGAAHAATTHYVYDALGRLIAAIDPAGHTNVYIYDAAGNLLSVSRYSSTEVSIVAFTPERGKVGDTVTIYGSGFLSNPSQNTVTFGGAQATVTSAAPAQLVAAVPAGAATGPITVTNANGSATSARTFTVIVPPVITGVIPGVVAAGTTSVEIAGAQLAHATAVTFAQPGITAAISPGATSERLPVQINVASSVPAGSYSFSVTNAAGTTNSEGVMLTVGIAPSGPSFGVARPLSVFLPPQAQVAPSGSSASAGPPLSVFVPSAPQVAPSGASASVTVPVSVFLPPSTEVAPAGQSMSVTQPVSVSMP
jgi:large repetitive protein